MSKLEEKLAKSLTAESIELIPYLPYLLQDLWELGSSPKDMIHLISENIDMTENIKILDLACGKGAVSIHIAKRFGCQVKGIDIMPDFIEVARQKSREYEVQQLCDFIIGDINEAVESEKDFDIVILGAVGEVLGNQEETLNKLSATIKEDGYVLLDDGYAKTDAKGINITKERWVEIIERSGYRMIDELPVDTSEFSAVLGEQMECLKKRTGELTYRYPDKAHLFKQYLKSQSDECDELENDVTGITILLRKCNDSKLKG
jgi:2-polyprenyl-3-methyl-5-hydroxy-6-metoxy-1,4-benzoquinol methylase